MKTFIIEGLYSPKGTWELVSMGYAKTLKEARDQIQALKKSFPGYSFRVVRIQRIEFYEEQ